MTGTKKGDKNIELKNDNGEICKAQIYSDPMAGRGVCVGDENFYPIGWCFTHICFVWPVEEFIARQKICGANLKELEIHRLRRKNQHGKCECLMPNGWIRRGVKV